MALNSWSSSLELPGDENTGIDHHTKLASSLLSFVFLIKYLFLYSVGVCISENSSRESVISTFCMGSGIKLRSANLQDKHLTCWANFVACLCPSQPHFLVLGLGPRTSCVQGKCSTAMITVPTLFYECMSLVNKSNTVPVLEGGIIGWECLLNTQGTPGSIPAPHVPTLVVYTWNPALEVKARGSEVQGYP